MRKFIGTIAVFVVVGGLLTMLTYTRAAGPWWTELPPGEKRDLLAHEEAARFAVPPAPKDREIARPEVVQPDVSRPVGIIEEGEYPDNNVKIRNRWQGPFGDGVVQIFAGAKADEPMQGLVIVHWLNKDWELIRKETYLSPMKMGSVKIVAVKNGIFTLQVPDGKILTFDIRTKAFRKP